MMKRAYVSLLGTGLSGKRTILELLASNFSAKLHCRQAAVLNDEPFSSITTPLSSAAFEYLEHQVSVWCLSGGIPPQWALPYLKGSSVAVVVLDPQQTVSNARNAFFEILRPHLSLDRTFFIIPKKDIHSHCACDSPSQLIPKAYCSIPYLEYSALSGNARMELAAFFLTYIFPAAISAGPLLKREAIGPFVDGEGNAT